MAESASTGYSSQHSGVSTPSSLFEYLSQKEGVHSFVQQPPRNHLELSRADVNLLLGVFSAVSWVVEVGNEQVFLLENYRKRILTYEPLVHSDTERSSFETRGGFFDQFPESKR